MFRHLLALGIRNLIKQQLYSSINVIGLTIGLLSFVLIMLYVSHERGFDKFNKKSERIYRLSSANKERVAAIVSYAWGQSLKNELSDIENLVSFQKITIGLTTKKDEHVYAQYGILGADSTFFEIFDYPVIKGNRHEFLRHPHKIVITPEAAVKYFKGEDPVGQTLQMNLWGTWVTYEVEGLVSCPLNSHVQFEFLIPIHLVKKYFFSPTAFTSWTIRTVYTYLLMREGYTYSDKIRTEFQDFLYRHGGDELKEKLTLNMEPLEEIYLRSELAFDFQPRGNVQHIQILILVAIGILLMAIINFINISSAQSLRRLKEVSIKKILGSGKGSLIIQFVGESTFLSLLSMVFSAVLLILILPYFNDFTGKSFTLTEILNFSNFLMMLGLALMVGVISGIYPALVLSSFKPVGILNSRSAGRSISALTRKILVTTQFGLAVVLLIATGIIHRQVNYMQQKDLGFNKDQVIVINNARLIASSPIKTQLLREELTKSSGIYTVSASSTYPGQHSWSDRYLPEGHEAEESVSLSTIFVDHDFLPTYDVDIVQGRNFNRAFPSDSGAFLINEAAVKFFSNKDPSWLTDPLSKDLTSTSGNRKGKVIGVFRDFNFESLKQEISPLVILIHPPNLFTIQLKFDARNISETTERIEDTWSNLFPEIPLDYRFMDQEFAVHFQSDQKLGKLLQLFAILSILVATLGLFGLASFLAFEKAKEMSIRKVIGASEKQLVLLLSWLFLKLIVIANVLAIPLSYLLMTQWLEQFAYRIQMPMHVFLLTSGTTISVTILTIGYHVYKTATMNPVQVLAQE